MAFRKALGWGSFQSLLRMALGIISVKVTAAYLGPSGVAMMGQLTNVLAFITGLAANGSATAVSRFTAEYRKEPERVASVFSSGVRFSLLVSIVIAVGLLFFLRPLANWLFHDAGKAWVIYMLAVVTPLIALGPVIAGYITGLKEFSTTSKIIISSQVVTFFLFVGMTVKFGLAGGMSAVILGTAAMFVIALVWSMAKGFLGKSHFLAQTNKLEYSRVIKFFPLAIVHGVTMPFALILVRDQISGELGIDAAGHWQAVWRVSEVYLAVFMSTMSLYFMPRLSELSEPRALSNEIRRTVMTVVGMVALVALIIFVMRDIIIVTLYTAEFMPMRDLFGYQLLGDVLRMVAWSLGFVLVAKDYHRWYVVLEILMPGIFILCTYLFLSGYGLIVAPIAYIVAYLINVIVVAMVLRKLIFHSRRDDSIVG